MVLRKTAILWLLFVVSSIPACLRPRVETEGQRVALTLSFSHQDAEGAIAEVPRSFQRQVRLALGKRGFEEDLSAERSLDVATRATFYSSLEGRFRWTVHVEATWRGFAPQPIVQRFTMPAVMNFPHEDADDTLRYTSRALAKELAIRTEELRRNPEAASVQAARHDPRYGIYFVMVDRFANGDPQNDEDAEPSDPQSWHGGDLRGLVEHLDHIADLGVRAIWLSPIYESRDAAFDGHGAYHGYWPYDFFSLEPRFGSEEDLSELRKRVEEKGMVLILDTVLNHVGYEAPWVSEHPDWFHRRGTIEDWSRPEEVTQGQVHGLPDLAQENRAVFQALVNATSRWQSLVRPSGLRLDAVRHIDGTFWRAFNREARELGLITLGELYDGDPAVLANAMREQGFDRLFDFPLYYALLDVFCQGHSPQALASLLSLDRLYPDPARLVPFVDNHDVSRVATSCGEHTDSLLRFALSVRGEPALQYGTESGLLGASEPENRGDMRFEKTGRYGLIQGLLQAGARFPSMTRGRYVPLLVDEESFVYARVVGSEATLVAAHFGNSERSIKLPKALQEGEVVFSDPPGDFALRPGTAVQVRRNVAKLPDAQPATVRFVGKGASVSGAGPELGHWDPGRARPLPVTLAMPEGTTLAFKLVRQVDGVPAWESGDNRYLHVTGDAEVELSWRE